MFISCGFLVFGVTVEGGWVGSLPAPTMAVMLEIRLDRSLAWPAGGGGVGRSGCEPGVASRVGLSPGGLGRSGLRLALLGRGSDCCEDWTRGCGGVVVGTRAVFNRSMADVPDSSCFIKLLREAVPCCNPCWGFR